MARNASKQNISLPSLAEGPGEGPGLGLLPHYYSGLIEAGCDEAGRGCLAGSVYAAAVILPPDYHNDELNDSKQLSEKKRYQLREQIERDAIAWAVGIVTPEEIDKINILRASFLAMHRAIDQLTTRPEALIIDGNRFTPYHPFVYTESTEETEGTEVLNTVLNTEGTEETEGTEGVGTELVKKSKGKALAKQERATTPLPHTCIIKGDGKYLAIAAASILAKTYRDDYMNALAKEYPQYDWLSNKGYPTKKHRQAIRDYGTTPYHRLSYNLLGTQELSLDFKE